MSVSGAGVVPSDVAAAAEAAGGGEAGAQQQQGGVPPNFAERFDKFVNDFGGVGERIDRIEQALTAEPEGGEGEHEGEYEDAPQTPDSRFLMDPESGLFYDRLTGEWHDDVPGEFEQGGEELTVEDVQAMIQDGIAEGIQPFQQNNLRQQYAALEEAYPALRDKAVVAEIAAEGQRLVAQIPGADPEAWKSPALLESLYLARQARETAGGEVPATGEPSTQLEGSSAATGAQELEDEGDAIVKAGRNGSFFR